MACLKLRMFIKVCGWNCTTRGVQASALERWKRDNSSCCPSEEISLKLNHSEEVESALNVQIQVELAASYTYLAFAYEFQRDTLALPGFHLMFLHSSREETEHAEKLMEYQNKRGGKLTYMEIKPPNLCQLTAQLALKEAINTEKKVTQALEEVIKLGEKCKDYHLCDFIASVYLNEQYADLKRLCDLYTQLNTAGGGLGLYMVDRTLLKKYTK